MEYVEGQTLREILVGGPIPTKRLIPLATQMAEGLAKAHSAGIVHRDLKPENVMVTGDGFVKLLDFGLAKLTHRVLDDEADGSEVATMTRELTREGTIVGTLGYMSPEQASGRTVDHRSDQFSFGAVLYEMATGEIAFKRGTAAETLAAIIEGEPKPIARVNPKVPAQLRVIVERCLSKEPSERYESTRDLAKELERFREIRLEPPAALTRRTAIAGVAALAAVGLAGLLGLNVGGLRDRLLGEAGPGRIDSLAVLPLANLSGDPEQDYFVDGMTDLLITELAQIGALKVIARTSVFRLRDKDMSLSDIARALDVDGIVEGSVLRVGDRVRITAQLIHAPTDRNLWARSYERDLRDILSLQSEVAREIAREIRVTVTPQERARLAAARPVDPEANEAYLKGLYYLRSGTGYTRGNEYFLQAIEKDPDYALAYGGLALTYIGMGNFRLQPAGEAFSKAQAAAMRALELDETAGRGHAPLAWVKMVYERDWSGAEQASLRAVELNPGATWGHYVRAYVLQAIGRLEEAVASARRARELDPLSVPTNNLVGRMLHFDRRYDQAIHEYLKTLELNPDFPPARLYLGWAYLQKGMLEEAVDELERWVRLTGEQRIGPLAHTLALAGRRAEAEELLHELLERPKIELSYPGDVALVYTALGDKDEAFAWLDKAYDAYYPMLFQLQAPMWDPLRSDPRFTELLRRLNLPVEAYSAGKTSTRAEAVS
jgi:TolB-like protein/Tfp pilus assembly protein PilF